jgi:hypothetical protein
MNARPGSVNRASIWRGEDDHYPTPPGATWALCNLGILPDRVWEPACGDGAMASVLSASGKEVVATTLVPRGYGEPGVDFLQEKTLRAPAIVTNPPFKIADDFIAHALSLEPEVACFFLRLKCLEGRRRYNRIYATRPLTSVQVFIERVKFYAGDTPVADQPGWNTEAFAWFIWSKKPLPLAPIGWISRDSNGGVFA